MNYAKGQAEPQVLQAQRRALGLDISQWQSEAFPFDKAAQEGYAFVYLRASVRCKHDPCYHVNHQRAIDAGLMTGSYHYLYPTPRPADQAAAFFRSISGILHCDALPPALDVEENELTEKDILAFIAAWSWISNDTPLGIYTSKSKWYNIVGPGAEWAQHHPLWIADWRHRDEPATPRPWQHWTFWQWTSKGRIPGYPGPVDLNYFNGTTRQLKNGYPELWT